MIALIKRLDNSRNVIRIDRYYADEIRLHPAGLIELKGKDIPGDILYLRYLATDLMDIIIMDEGTSNATEPKK